MTSLDHPPSAGKPFQAPPTCRSQVTYPRKAGNRARKIPSTLLADIKFERQNKPQPRLPPNHRIQKRPITHSPIAAPYAGSDVQKVVYVSRTTPIMAAVKRVKKLLEQVEKRSLQREGVLEISKRVGKKSSMGQQKKSAKQEEILVKGSGRAIEQAVKVGEWFKRHAEDGDGEWVVQIRPKSVKVIDDIVEDVPPKADGRLQEGKSMENDRVEEEGLQQAQAKEADVLKHGRARGEESDATGTAQHPRDRGRKKRKRPMYEEDDVPEARTRFIDAVEIGVSLKE